jgi:hypothetical protein
MEELKEQVKVISHLNIVVSWIPIHIFQGLQIGIFHDIRLQGEEAHRELTKVMLDHVVIDANGLID